MAPSSEVVAKFPSALQVASQTWAVWPCNERDSVPIAGSHTLIALPLVIDASNLASRLHDTLLRQRKSTLDLSFDGCCIVDSVFLFVESQVVISPSSLI